MWKIPDYGEVGLDNRIWTSLEKLEVYRNGTFDEVLPKDMEVGETGYALFRSAGVTRCEIVRTSP